MSSRIHDPEAPVTDDEYTTWQASLKPGDTVAVANWCERFEKGGK
jgi:hypothetical protein